MKWNLFAVDIYDCTIRDIHSVSLRLLTTWLYIKHRTDQIIHSAKSAMVCVFFILVFFCLWLMPFYLLKIEFQIACKQWRSRITSRSNIWTGYFIIIFNPNRVHQKCHRFIPKFPVEWTPSIFSLEEHTTIRQLKMDGDIFFVCAWVDKRKKLTLFQWNWKTSRDTEKRANGMTKKKRKLRIAAINYTLTLNVCVVCDDISH